MKERILTIPELILIAGNRVALGVGISLLIADKFTDHERKVPDGRSWVSTSWWEGQARVFLLHVPCRARSIG
jgi:hypothetical protein